MGSSPWEILFSQQQLILLLLSQPCLILNNSSMHANKETANRDFFFLHRNRIKSKQIRLAGWIRHREPPFCGRASTKCVKSSSTRFAGWFSRRMFSLQTHCVCVCVCSGCYARSTGQERCNPARGICSGMGFSAGAVSGRDLDALCAEPRLWHFTPSHC